MHTDLRAIKGLRNSIYSEFIVLDQ
uniref:Uncharacterized protein n=1 Tax=Arundo donax TaxID=35708 RepID=A0A0A8YJK7_ARUDO